MKHIHTQKNTNNGNSQLVYKKIKHIKIKVHTQEKSDRPKLKLKNNTHIKPKK